jgi:glutathione S-transferase
MIDKEDRFGWQIRQWLNRSAMDVSPTVQNRLELARKQALSRQRKAARRVLVAETALAAERFAKKTAPFDGWFSGFGAAMPALAVVLGLFFMSDAQMNGEARRLADIDAMVLGDELPISAYMDDGFSAYLKRTDIEKSAPATAQEMETPPLQQREDKIDLKRI